MILSPLVLVALAAPPVVSCPASPPPAPTQVVARVNGRPITVADVDREVGAKRCGPQLEYRQQLQGLRQSALDALVNRPLLKAEAARRGLKDVQILMKAVSAEAPVPDEEALRAFYEANKEQVRGMAYEEVRDAIEEHLTEEAAELHLVRFIERLRAKSKVRVDLPPIRIQVAATGPSRGPAEAPITIVEFADYQCPYCARAAGAVRAVLKRYPAQVRLVFRDYPLGFHDRALPAAVAARCAGEQGKYWEMHDALFSGVRTLDDGGLTGYAADLKLDPKLFARCQGRADLEEAVGRDLRAGGAAGVNGTPAFFVNGVLLSGAQPERAFVEVIEAELKRRLKR